MGCLCARPQESSTVEEGGLELSVTTKPRSRSGTKYVVPEAVQGLVLVQDRREQPSASLRWKPPANLSSGDLSHYHVTISCAVSNQVLKEVQVEPGKTRLDFPGDEHLQPLRKYLFSVHAVSCNGVTGDLQMLDGMIDWQCRFPGCEKNRLKLEDRIYDFCSRDHKIEFDEGYCLYRDCKKLVTAYDDPTLSPSTTAAAQKLVREMKHFCSHDHYYRILKTEPDVAPGFFIEVKSNSPEYKSVEELFHKNWSSKDLESPRKAPTLRLVLAIVNPSLEHNFQQYKQLYIRNEKADTKMVKKAFYGVNLGCDLHEYQVPCNRVDSSECNMCELALHGFGRLCKSVGSGVTFNRNPAWSHDKKAKMHEDSCTYGLLMCEVACVKSKKLERTQSDSQVPRDEQFDTVKVNVKRGLTFKKSTDDVIVYKADAVCPRYILLYYV